MSNLLTPAEVSAFKLRRERLPIWEMVEDDDNHQIIIAPYAGSTGSTADFVREARSDIPRLLADRKVLVKLLARAHGYLIQLVDDNDIFIDPECVERVNEFCKEIEDAGVLAQVEGREETT